MTRQESILKITRRLIILTGIGLALIGALFGATLFRGEKFMVSWSCLLAGIISGKFFPQFSTPSLTGPVTKEYFISFFKDTYPASGEDLAKLLLWCFIAGFSERFVPQIISDVAVGVAPNAASTRTPVPPQKPN